MHAIRLFACWWFWDGTLMHAVCPLSLWPEFQTSQMEKSRKKLRCNWAVVNKIVRTVRACLMSERTAGGRIVWKLAIAFFLLWSIFVCSPFGKLTKQLDDWRCVFFMWEPASVIHRENAIFYPQLLFTGSKCQKTTSVSKANLIKATIWKVHALIFDHSALNENSKFACVILEVNFPL